MSFFRNLFSWRASTANATVAASPSPAPPAIPKIAPTGPAPALGAAEPAAPPDDAIAFSLKTITDLFPPELKAALRKQPSEHVQIYIPRAVIQPQLGTGAVRITFAQLRAVTPGIFFHPDGANADAKVMLPLETVLRRMMPTRHDNQRQPAIPVNIPSIFVKAGAGPAGKGTAEPWYSQRRPTYESKPEPDSTPVSPTSVNGRKPPTQAAQSRSPAPQPASVPARPPGATPFTPPTAPIPTPAIHVPSARPDSITVPLSSVLPALPPEIQQTINRSGLGKNPFIIPLAECESRMRSGNLRFKWSQLRIWCGVELSTSPAEDTEVELPLATIVPLFLAARQAPDLRKKVEVDARIPDVFGKSIGPTSAPPPAPAAMPAPPPSAPEAEAAQPVAGVTGPEEILRQIRALKGVAGAFLATSDGLLIAGNLPDSNDNVLAAFAPTAFSQLAKYADMARLGIPDAVELHLSGTTLHIRKAGKLYLGALLAHGSQLPNPELDRIAIALQSNPS